MKLLEVDKYGLVIWGSRDGKQIFSSFNIVESPRELDRDLLDLKNFISYSDSWASGTDIFTNTILQVKYVENLKTYTIYGQAFDLEQRPGYFAITLVIPIGFCLSLKYFDALQNLYNKFKEIYLRRGDKAPHNKVIERNIEASDFAALFKDFVLLKQKEKQSDKRVFSNYMEMDYFSNRDVDVVENIFNSLKHDIKNLFIIHKNHNDTCQIIDSKILKINNSSDALEFSKPEKLRLVTNDGFPDGLVFDIGIRDFNNTYREINKLKFVNNVIELNNDFDCEDILTIRFPDKYKLISKSTFCIEECHVESGYRIHKIEFEKIPETLQVRFEINKEAKNESITIKRNHKIEFVGSIYPFKKIPFKENEQISIEFKGNRNFKKFNETKHAAELKKTNNDFVFSIKLDEQKKVGNGRGGSKILLLLGTVSLVVALLVVLITLIMCILGMFNNSSSAGITSINAIENKIVSISNPSWNYTEKEAVSIIDELNKECKNGNSKCKALDKKLKDAIENAKFRRDAEKNYVVNDSMNKEDLESLLQKLAKEKKNFESAFGNENKFNLIQQQLEIKILEIEKEKKSEKTKIEKPKDTRTPEEKVNQFITSCTITLNCLNDISCDLKKYTISDFRMKSNSYCSECKYNTSTSYKLLEDYAQEKHNKDSKEASVIWKKLKHKVENYPFKIQI
jgi:hypothetical protein